MIIFSYGNIGGFPGNSHAIMKYKKFICLSNLQLNYTRMLDRGTCRSTQYFCFRVVSHHTLCDIVYTGALVANLELPLDDGLQKAMQSVITNLEGMKCVHLFRWTRNSSRFD